MSKNKRVLGFLLSLIMLVCQVPVQVHASEQVSCSNYATYVNPMYEDLVGYIDVSENGESYFDVNIEELEVAATYSTIESAAEYLKSQMVNRVTNITFKMPFDIVYNNQNTILNDIFNKALEYTEECNGQEGDALACSFTTAGMGYSGNSNDGMTLTYEITYLSTAEQEQELTTEVNMVMTELALGGKTEYEKVKAIHDYICDNVDYDYTYTKYSAYDALCTGTAVCQGYAVLFYRMCKEAGLPVRIITGMGQTERHAWNIVQIGDVYYNIDCTWDGQDPETNYSYFLLNEIDFVGHTRDDEYLTTEFNAAYPMAEYSYGKDTVELPNMDNLDVTFTTIDDSTVTSHADGKPKVLVFFRTTCFNSQSTIKSIVDSEIAGVDIIALDVDAKTKADVLDFKENYGSDDIVFSYSESTINNQTMWSYLYKVGINTSVTLPVVCYIDANDKFQCCTTGLSSGWQIISNLKRYCGYTEVVKEYTITYNLDGGTNHPDNPATFTSKTETITLQDPVKTGYAFKGWYADAEFTTPVTQIVKGTKENLVLYAKFVKELELVVPAKTTYVVGEKIDLTGGSVTHGQSGETATITNAMISGFSSEEAGVYAVTVTYKNCSTSFEVLVVDIPSLRADYGQALSELTLPTSEYGVYNWADASTVMSQVGENECLMTFTPNDARFNVREDLKAKVSVYRSISDVASIILTENNFVYNGLAHTPGITVMLDESVLDAANYIYAYRDNVNAGTATVTVSGQDFYEGSKEVTFIIDKAKLTIKARDLTIAVGDELPVSCEYEITGLVQGDTLIEEPEFSYNVENSQISGVYIITPSGAVASSNYDENITYINGKLQIAQENVAYIVDFDVQGIGEAPDSVYGVIAGSMIAAPEIPVAEGYTFAGWYKDSLCKTQWDFEKDVVQSDIILYAKWLVNKAGSSFAINDIGAVYYTGKALKPAVQVYDGDTLLKINKDYTIKYFNNTNVNTVPSGETFDNTLPYITITGKGNYSETISVNFDILPAAIGDGSAASGVALKLDEQLVVNTKADVSPLKSIKFGRAMKQNVDYTLKLIAVNAKDSSGNTITGEMANGMIPAGSSGTFSAVITGIGNYTGRISKPVVVTAKNQLMKNAKITIGKNIKSLQFDYYKDELNSALPVGYYDAGTKKYYAVVNGEIDYSAEVKATDVFTVKCGNQNLIYQKDFVVSYLNDKGVGTATLTVTGIGNYAGSKSVTFKLTGKAFNAKTVSVEGVSGKTYTGYAITQNSASLTYTDGTPLKYGKDYTIKYSQNINKGTAVMTFVAKDSSGYQGKFTKKFAIGAANVSGTTATEETLNIVMEYDKAGVKPVAQIILTNTSGKRLVMGKDYTLSYKNNKAVAGKTDGNAPVIIVKGKGNYTGTRDIPFTITQASLYSDKITGTVKELAYNASKSDTYEYKPTVKIMDGKKALSVNKDYTVSYENNTQAAYEAYYITGTASGNDAMPKVIISASVSGNYSTEEPIVIPLPVYQKKFTASNLYAVIEDVSYTGRQVTPQVSIYYSDDKVIIANLKKDGIRDEEAIIRAGAVKLTDEDYNLSYGANITAGKNKGTVKVSGQSPKYGGNVTFKFNIGSRKIVR